MGLSLISWERSSAHFNIGVTVANIFVDLNYFSLIFLKSVLIIIVQFAAACAAMGVCRFMVQIEIVDSPIKDKFKEIQVQPVEPMIVPVDPTLLNNL